MRLAQAFVLGLMFTKPLKVDLYENFGLIRVKNYLKTLIIYLAAMEEETV